MRASQLGSVPTAGEKDLLGEFKVDTVYCDFLVIVYISILL